MNASASAPRLFACARRGPPLPRLPESMRPTTLEEAEAIQHATLSALRASPAGWKIGRHAGHVFSAPMPDSAVVVTTDAATVPIAPGGRIELELALSFTGALSPADVASLRVDALPTVARLATLFEFVRSRFETSAETGPLDRIADCVSNEGAAFSVSGAPWSPGVLDAPPATRLWQDDVLVAEHAGPHVAAPIAPLLDAWLDRLRREGRGLRAGEVVTLGSLTGILPIPAEGARYRGEIAGLAPLSCTVTPAQETRT